MSRILAIEADPKRKRLLAGLVREFVKAELNIADNARAAIALIQSKVPDIILAPALLSPADGAELMACVRQLRDAPYVQLVTIPALDMLSDAPREESRGLLAPLLRRRSAPIVATYDRSMVGSQIADALASAHQARRDHEAAIAYREEAAREAAERRERSLIRPFDGAVARMAGVDDLVVETVPFAVRSAEDRRTAVRRAQQELPWLSGVRVGWGSDVSLVNISSSGVLMETGSKVVPGSTTELLLSGPETSLVVPVRFVRSDVARIDRLGVKYHAAGEFGKEIDLSDPHRAVSASRPRALVELLASALNRGKEPAHAAFIRGVAELVGARDIQLRAIAPGLAGSRDPHCFDVPDDRFRRTLHVVLDRHRMMNDEERRLLRAAALLTAAALELDAPVRALDSDADPAGGMKLLAS